ncbi:hypothetical protein FKP32DRAFT_1679352 [Trametes sanguinea]|nr:hypothetical protein FKP32DRAFT_1679352 [Trametes sanguinea]
MSAVHTSAVDIPDEVRPRRFANAPQVQIPKNGRLSSTVTYSDLPGGYKTVTRELEMVDSASDHRFGSPDSRDALVFSEKGWKELLDDPDSIALLVVSNNAIGRRYHAVVSITHRKLRYLLSDAVRWYMAARGDRSDDLLTVYIESGEHEFSKSTLPEGLTFFNVDPNGSIFQQPSSRRIPPPMNLRALNIALACARLSFFLLLSAGLVVLFIRLAHLSPGRLAFGDFSLPPNAGSFWIFF